MAIEDVIRDLNIYFDSIHKPVQLKAHMGGIVNPSYLMIKYEGKEQVLPFWATAGGGNKEKELAAAFKDDIETWITDMSDNDAERERLKSLSTPTSLASEMGLAEPARPKRVKKAT